MDAQRRKGVPTIMHAFAPIGSRNLTVMIPSGSCYKERTKKETVSDQPGYTGQGKNGGSLTLRGVVHYFLVSSSNPSRANMCSKTMTRSPLFAQLLDISIRHHGYRTELVLRILIFRFFESLGKVRSAGGHQRNGPLHLPGPLRHLHNYGLPLPSLPSWTLLLRLPELGLLIFHPCRATQPGLSLIRKSERHQVFFKEGGGSFVTERPVLASVNLDFRFVFIAPRDHPAFTERSRSSLISESCGRFVT